METYTIREVKLLQQSSAKVTRLRLIHTVYNRRDCYEIAFAFTANRRDRHSLLITTRNQPYRLADLNRGIKFIKNLFPDAVEIELTL